MLQRAIVADRHHPRCSPSLIPERLEQAVVRILTGLSITASAIERERREMRWHRFGRTRSRHVLGSMNDFGQLAEYYIRDDGPDVDLERVERMLNDAPCRPIQYQSPDRLTPALFARARPRDS